MCNEAPKQVNSELLYLMYVGYILAVWNAAKQAIKTAAYEYAMNVL